MKMLKPALILLAIVLALYVWAHVIAMPDLNPAWGPL